MATSLPWRAPPCPHSRPTLPATPASAVAAAPSRVSSARSVPLLATASRPAPPANRSPPHRPRRAENGAIAAVAATTSRATPSAASAAIPSFLPRVPTPAHSFPARQHPALPHPTTRAPRAPSAARASALPFDFADGALTSGARTGDDGDADGGGGAGRGERGEGSSARSEIIFVGTGTSEGIPRVSCLTNPDKTCPVCEAATLPGNKNRRRNTSLLLRHCTHANGHAQPVVTRNILIDAGKFFYHSALQWFPYHSIRHIDAVLITHSHADAIGGLDDLRDWTNNVQDDIPVYASHRDLKVMEKTHYYLVDTSSLIPGTAVSALHFHAIDAAPFHVHSLKVTPLPVWHGANYLSFGYRFGDVCYIRWVT
ncbi:hypothetical protein CLOP_g10205 [Closterium sp. NIES-67]|nr:hypothetical protein CLOP_g10205 [Closterium sp. NIES-67]